MKMCWCFATIAQARQQLACFAARGVPCMLVALSTLMHWRKRVSAFRQIQGFEGLGVHPKYRLLDDHVIKSTHPIIPYFMITDY